MGRAFIRPIRYGIMQQIWQIQLQIVQTRLEFTEFCIGIFQGITERLHCVQ